MAEEEIENSVSDEDFSPERITELTAQLATKMDRAIKDMYCSPLSKVKIC